MSALESTLNTYGVWIKGILWVASIALAGWLGHHMTALSYELDQTKSQLSTVSNNYTEYQQLVKERDDLKDKYINVKADLDKLQQDKQNDLTNKTQQLLDTLRSPNSVYAKADCGEAGSYPTVFGTSFGATDATPSK